MWRNFLALILLPSLAAAQASSEVHPAISPQTVSAILYGPPRTTATSAAYYQSYTRFTAIRRGSEEDVGIMLTIRGFVTAPSSTVPGVVPLKLEFEPLPGFTINEVHGPKVWKSDFKFQGEVVQVSAAPYVQFKVRADRSAPLGAQVLKGRFTFQKVPPDGSDVGPVERVDVQIPFTVVESNAKVRKADFPYGPMPGWETFLVVAAIPILIVMIIPLLILCTVTGTCPRC